MSQETKSGNNVVLDVKDVIMGTNMAISMDNGFEEVLKLIELELNAEDKINGLFFDRLSNE